MKMKQISAATIQEALATARRELGDDAVLLETKKNVKGKGVVVTFAIEANDEPLFDNDNLFDSPADILPFSPEIPKPAAAKVELEHPAMALIAEAFTYHSLPLALAQRLLTTLYRIPFKPDALIEVAQAALAEALAQNLPFQPIAMAADNVPDRAMMLVGPHGAGKTSTIVKLATELTLHNKPLVLISTDTQGLNAAENLQKISEILKCDFYVAEKRQQLKALLQQYRGKAWMLVDSIGANIYEFAQMKALGELAGLQGVEPILTCPAGLDADEAQEMANVFSFLPIERMIVTRLDATRRLHGVFAALTSGGYALANFSQSPIPSDACTPLSPSTLSRFMLRHVRERMTH